MPQPGSSSGIQRQRPESGPSTHGIRSALTLLPAPAGPEPGKRLPPGRQGSAVGQIPRLLLLIPGRCSQGSSQ